MNKASYNRSHSSVSTLFANNSTIGENMTDYVQYSLPYESRLLFGYIQLIVVIVGFIGNILAIAVLTRPKHRNSSTATYLTALAFSDIIILLSGPSTELFYLVHDFDLLSHGTFWCKFVMWLIYGSVSTSSWLLVAVTIERTLSVTFPYQVKRSCTPKIAKNVVIAIWCAMYVLHSHFLYGMGLVQHRENIFFCVLQTGDYIEFFNFVLPWINLTVVFLIPCFLILIGNIVIIVQLARNRRKRQNMTRSKQHTETKLIVSLVLVNVAFVLTMSPLSMFDILGMHLDLPQSTYYFVNYLLNVVSNVNAATNFFLYFMSGAKFRADLKKLFKSVSMKLRGRSTREKKIFRLTHSTLECQ